jgi:uncharacterized repeat protein (TIGR03803 family)
VLHSFTGRSDDAGPSLAALTLDPAGNLYGTTSGGEPGHGEVFRLAPIAKGNWKETVLHYFTGKDGAVPFAGLIFDGAGNLYGTTSLGGNLSYCDGYGCGVVFKLAPNSNGGWHDTILHYFVDHPGAKPYAGLISDAVGNLYGTTIGDRDSTFGSVFEITP